MKKKQIVEKTYELIFIEKQNVNFRMITEKLGISLGSINYHFENKENLLFEASKMYFQEHMHDEENVVDYIYKLNEGLCAIHINRSLVIELVYIIQARLLPVSIDRAHIIFLKEYPGIKREKVASILVTVQMIAINDDLNNSIYKVDFEDKDDIEKLLDKLITQPKVPLV